MRIPPYSPELNPAEKIWQWMKNKVAMKFLPDVESLQEKITEMVKNLKPELVKSITGYEFYINNFFEYF